MRTARLAAILTVLGAILTGCGSSAATTAFRPTPLTVTPTPATASRPSSSATVTITSPLTGGTVTDRTVVVVVAVTGATIVQGTSTDIRPDRGHVHLYVDGNLHYMAYQLSQVFHFPPGTYSLYAEFVASDHFPFSPRVYSNHIIFTVA